ncbi:hypothetical protein ABZ729_02745 [Streptomyces sp. NPDC006678]|uniref:hypothetical protein n=1 Tax=unclassified Streptomyces TaxID=2593676 RepID=UPI0033ECAD19
MPSVTCFFSPVDCAREITASLAETILEQIALAIGDAAQEAIKALYGLWLEVPSDGGGIAVGAVGEQTAWIVGYAAVASLVVAAIRVALDRRGEPAKQTLKGMLRLVLVTGAGTYTATLLAQLSDNYARYLFARSDLGTNMKELLGATTLLAPVLVLLLALLVLLATVVQVVLTYIRLGVMVTLIATLPLAAAASMTAWGDGWWKRHVGWLIGWMLYKPAAALILFSATSLTADGSPVHQKIAGVSMLVLSVFALPALLKLVVPATSALGDASGGQVVMGAASSVAYGSSALAGGFGAGAGPGGGGGAGPDAGPTGARPAAAAAAASSAAAALPIALQTGTRAVTDVMSSLGDHDGTRGHN